MPKYKVTYEAVPKMVYEIEAEDENEARDIADDMWFDEETPIPTVEEEIEEPF